MFLGPKKRKTLLRSIGRFGATALIAAGIVLLVSATFVSAKSGLLAAPKVYTNVLTVGTKFLLNGVIANNTKTKGKDNPVKINDNVNVAGTLSVKNLSVSGTSPFLREIDCAEGSFLQKASSGWACGVAVVTDVLAGLNCTEGQVPKWTSGAWTCSDNAGATGPQGATKVTRAARG